MGGCHGWLPWVAAMHGSRAGTGGWHGWQPGCQGRAPAVQALHPAREGPRHRPAISQANQRPQDGPGKGPPACRHPGAPPGPKSRPRAGPGHQTGRWPAAPCAPAPSQTGGGSSCGCGARDGWAGGCGPKCAGAERRGRGAAAGVHTGRLQLHHRQRRRSSSSGKHAAKTGGRAHMPRHLAPYLLGSSAQVANGSWQPGASACLCTWCQLDSARAQGLRVNAKTGGGRAGERAGAGGQGAGRRRCRPAAGRSSGGGGSRRTAAERQAPVWKWWAARGGRQPPLLMLVHTAQDTAPACAPGPSPV